MLCYTTAINAVFAFLIAGGICFSRGRVTDELLRRGGIYAHMAELQSPGRAWKIQSNTPQQAIGHQICCPTEPRK